MIKKKLFSIVLLVLAALLFTLAPAAQADTVVLTDSAQLNLDGRVVLAAVNFHDPARVGNGNVTVDNPIQGVTFDNFNVVADDDGSGFAVAQGTLSTVIS